jgi:hypothetical protein
MIVALERTVGRQVRDAAGQKIGHLHEVRARREGDDLVVVDYIVGEAGLVERFSIASYGRAAVRLFGIGHGGGYCIPWHEMDLSDPEKPVCKRVVAELQRF